MVDVASVALATRTYLADKFSGDAHRDAVTFSVDHVTIARDRIDDANKVYCVVRVVDEDDVWTHDGFSSYVVSDICLKIVSRSIAAITFYTREIKEQMNLAPYADKIDASIEGFDIDPNIEYNVSITSIQKISEASMYFEEESLYGAELIYRASVNGVD